MLRAERLLIIEEQFLIALDIQRIVEEANARQTVFARNFDEAAALVDRFGEFDLAIVTPPRLGTSDTLVAEHLAASVPAIVVCSAGRFDARGTPFANAEIVNKPFLEDDLLAACQRALARRTSP